MLRFRQCEHHSEQFKPYFEPLTFAKLRCLLKLEYFDFVGPHFHAIKKSEFFHCQFEKQDKVFLFNCCSTDRGVFLTNNSTFVVFLHCALREPFSQSLIKHALATVAMFYKN